MTAHSPHEYRARPIGGGRYAVYGPSGVILESVSPANALKIVSALLDAHRRGRESADAKPIEELKGASDA